LAVSGAEPKFISAGFIIEEGFLIEKLWEISVSMKRAADKAGVKIVTGDTKVVEKGKGDGIFINTAGIGVLKHDIELDPLNCQPGDKIILNGKIGDHGIEILSAREGLSFKSDIKSDTAPLNNMIKEILAGSKRVKMMRDVTRGGLSSILNEIAQQGNIGIDIHENSIPINKQVAAACEILGLDPLYIANEGKIIVIADSDECYEILKIMKNNEFGKDASIIGEVVENHPKRVNLITNIGTRRIIDMISGEQLPRIC
jgi:hydrogenase expression/formation protein HypE